DRGDRRGVHRLAGKGAVEIDEMQPRKAHTREGARLRRRILVEDGRAIHVALLEADGFAVLQIDRGEKNHGRLKASSAGNGRAGHARASASARDETASRRYCRAPPSP